MTSDSLIAEVHRTSDLLFAAAQEELSDLITGKFTLDHRKFSEGRSLVYKVVRIDGFPVRGGREWEEAARANVQNNCEVLSLISLKRDNSESELWFGIGVWGSDMVQYAEADRAAYVYRPKDPLDFNLLLWTVVRRQIEHGDGVRGKKTEPVAKAKGCAVAFLTFAVSASALSYLGHAAGIY